MGPHLDKAWRSNGKGDMVWLSLTWYCLLDRYRFGASAESLRELWNILDTEQNYFGSSELAPWKNDVVYSYKRSIFFVPKISKQLRLWEIESFGEYIYVMNLTMTWYNLLWLCMYLLNIQIIPIVLQGLIKFNCLIALNKNVPCSFLMLLNENPSMTILLLTYVSFKYRVAILQLSAGCCLKGSSHQCSCRLNTLLPITPLQLNIVQHLRSATGSYWITIEQQMSTRQTAPGEDGPITGLCCFYAYVSKKSLIRRTHLSISRWLISHDKYLNGAINVTTYTCQHATYQSLLNILLWFSIIITKIISLQMRKNEPDIFQSRGISLHL